MENSENPYGFPERVLGNAFRESNSCACYPPAILSMHRTRYSVISYYLIPLTDLTSQQVLFVLLQRFNEVVCPSSSWRPVLVQREQV